MTLAQDRVAAGAARLTRVFPDGWAGSIDLDRLDILGGTTCILGQLGGGEAYALETGIRRVYNAREQWAISHKGSWLLRDEGFFGDDEPSDPAFCLSPGVFTGYMASCAELTRAWRDHITAMREGGTRG